MPLAIALVVIFALIVAMWIAFAHDQGPGPADVAIAYEGAWDRMDFGMLYELSGDELRDGMRREQFVAARRAAHAGAAHAGAGAPARRAGRGSGAVVTVEDVAEADRTALVVTRVTAPGGGAVRNNVVLERRPTGWVVVRYGLRTDAATG